ncbi:M20/M25/M40 family metallo-hydrolase [Ureibacillus sp. NPDC094379]
MNTFSVKELMVRYGMMVEENELGLRCVGQNKQNDEYFYKVSEALKMRGISLFSEMVEEEFVSILEDLYESTGENLYRFDFLAMNTVDIYVRGLVMQLNRLGFETFGSCDGHDREHAHIFFESTKDARRAEVLLKYFGLSCRLRHKTVVIRNTRYELPGYSTVLAALSPEKAYEIFKENSPLVLEEEYFSLLEQLLSIYGVSEEEGEIRQFVIEHLKPYVDHLEVDHYGNVLAQVRKGNGPVVLLNAHLDTVDDFVKGRIIKKDGKIWSVSEGVLGADDRAGVCVLLAVARTLLNSKFCGTVKFAFTVEEEIGLIGARNVAKSFLWDIDMAFVVDRRGTGDIVTSCGGYIPFCSKQFGRRVERIGNRLHNRRWQVVNGGSSDTRIWAEQGINSVNLSAGYNHEHTNNEILDIDANYGTYELIMQLLKESRSLMSANLNRSSKIGESKDKLGKIG